METKIRLATGPGETVELVLSGPPKAIQELVQRLRQMAGPVDVTGGQCCWSLTREGTTMHVVVDSDKLAS
jgi:hypothetical protein